MSKKVEWMLSSLEGFEKPKIKLEQYATSAELSISMMELIDELVGIDGMIIADIGCGCGMLMTTVATCYQPITVVGMDIDEEALVVCRRNLETAEVEDNCQLIQFDALKIAQLFPREIFDIVVINPPFGTKNNEGIDLQFVKAGLSILRPGGSVFSLHKSTTRDFLVKTANKWENVEEAKCVAEMQWNLPATYKFHKQKSIDIAVDLIQFKKKLT